MHAIRNLARIARGTASVRYSQLGFGRTSSTSTTQQTPRNLMGFKDGTDNLKAEDTATVDQYVWAQPADGKAWMAGGSYLVSRRIRMLIEPWDSTPLDEQERVIGRQKGSGAPPGLQDEFDPIDFTSNGPSGGPLVDPKAHVRLAHPGANHGARLLRRGYSFVDGTDGLGRLNAGLFFLAYQRDPRTAFVTIQTEPRRQDPRQPQRVHPARRLGRVGLPARRPARRLVGSGPLRLTPRGGRVQHGPALRCATLRRLWRVARRVAPLPAREPPRHVAQTVARRLAIAPLPRATTRHARLSHRPTERPVGESRVTP